MIPCQLSYDIIINLVGSLADASRPYEAVVCLQVRYNAKDAKHNTNPTTNS